MVFCHHIIFDELSANLLQATIYKGKHYTPHCDWVDCAYCL